MRKITKRVLAAILCGFLALIVVRIVYLQHRLLANVVDVLTGKTVCTLAQVWAGERHLNGSLQIAERIFSRVNLVSTDGSVSLWETPRGPLWTPARMTKTALTLLLTEQESGFYPRQLINSGDVVLDCGANIGIFTRTALESGAGTVVAIEPVPDSIEAFERNFTDEISEGRVLVCKKGVWDTDASLPVTLSPDSIADSLIPSHGERGANQQLLALTTIDKIVAEYKLSRVDLIKMDIEGAEWRALKGASRTIKAFQPRLMVAAEHHPEDAKVIPEIVGGIDARYSMECGPCIRMFNLSPAVLYFRK